MEERLKEFLDYFEEECKNENNNMNTKNSTTHGNNDRIFCKPIRTQHGFSVNTKDDGIIRNYELNLKDTFEKWASESYGSFMIVPKQADRFIQIGTGVVFIDSKNNIICGNSKTISIIRSTLTSRDNGGNPIAINGAFWNEPNTCPDTRSSNYSKIYGAIGLLNNNYGNMVFDFSKFTGELIHVKVRTNCVSELLFDNGGCRGGVLVNPDDETFVYEAVYVSDVYIWDFEIKCNLSTNICCRGPVHFMPSTYNEYHASRKQDWIIFEESEQYLEVKNENNKIDTNGDRSIEISDNEYKK